MWKRLLLIRGAELLMFAVLAAVPLTVHNPYVLGLLTLLAIYGILLIGLDVTVGYLGQVNLAQAAFLGLGAYTAGLCVTKLGWGMPLATVAAIAVGTALGGLLALPALRLEGPQFALATLSFTALTVTALNELESLTGGAQGLSLTRPPLLGRARGAGEHGPPPARRCSGTSWARTSSTGCAWRSWPSSGSPCAICWPRSGA